MEALYKGRKWKLKVKEHVYIEVMAQKTKGCFDSSNWPLKMCHVYLQHL